LDQIDERFRIEEQYGQAALAPALAFHIAGESGLSGNALARMHAELRRETIVERMKQNRFMTVERADIHVLGGLLQLERGRRTGGRRGVCEGPGTVRLRRVVRACSPGAATRGTIPGRDSQADPITPVRGSVMSSSVARRFASRYRWAAPVAVFVMLATCSKAPEPPPAIPPVVGDPDDITQQVHNFCGGACHAYPPADSFPRKYWRDEVERGFRFFEKSGLALKAPPIESVVRYYEKQAPEELAPANCPMASQPLALKFEQRSYVSPAYIAYPVNSTFISVRHHRLPAGTNRPDRPSQVAEQVVPARAAIHARDRA